MRGRFLVNRAINFIRPKPRTIPLTAAEVLANTRGATLVEQANDLFYSSGVAKELRWQDMPLVKNPCDLWMYIDLMQKLRPSVIVETGTHYGASATFFADMMSVQGFPCTVVTVDFNPKWNYDPKTKNIISIVGYSVEPDVFRKVKDAVESTLTKRPGHVLVTLDSDHSKANVSKELDLYSPLVTPGSYVVVEDTNVNGHPSWPTFGPGPWEAVEDFLAVNKAFTPDTSCQRYLLTNNPRGWLRRQT